MVRWLVLLAVLAFAVPVAAQELPEEGSEDDQARGLFLAGKAAYDGGRYEDALEHFQRAYDLSARPGLLYNLGATAERLRLDRQALDAFERYLAEMPDAPNRPQVERRIALLRDAIASQATSEPEPAPVSTADAPPAETGSPVGAWLLVAGGAAVVGTGIALWLVAAGLESNVEDAAVGSAWTDVSDDYDQAKTFGTVGAVLVPVGAIAAGLGVAMLLGTGAGDEPVAVRVGPTGAQVWGTF
jgi:tetratricopeptide (TPR) repeat protein